jgi:hypothetical protein
MATLLSPTNVVCEVDSIVVRDDGEAFGGSEPYLWSVFFKIDGDTVTAKIDINNQGVTLTLDGDPTVTSPDAGSHGNLNLSGGSVDAGGFLGSQAVIDVPPAVGRFKTRLSPLPTTINLDSDSWIAEAIDAGVLIIEDLLDTLLSDGQCPQSEDDPSELLAHLGAQFVTDELGGLPGAFGALYLLMEEDSTDESVAEEARRALRDAFRDELTNTVMPSISFTGQHVSDLQLEEIEIKIKNKVADVIIGGINWWWLLLGTFGLGGLAVGAAIALDQDDALGSAQATMSHLDIALGDEQSIDADLLPEGNGDWSLSGRIGIDS